MIKNKGITSVIPLKHILETYKAVYQRLKLSFSATARLKTR